MTHTRWHWRDRRSLRWRCRPRIGPPEPSEDPAFDPAGITGIIPADLRTPYDAREVIARIVDGSRFDEFKARFGETLVTRVCPHHGLALRQSSPTTGVLFSDAAQKGAHFVELCSQRRIPLIFFAGYNRLHGRAKVRERRHRAARGEDGYRRRDDLCSQDHDDYRR